MTFSLPKRPRNSGEKYELTLFQMNSSTCAGPIVFSENEDSRVDLLASLNKLYQRILTWGEQCRGIPGHGFDTYAFEPHRNFLEVVKRFRRAAKGTL